MLEQGGHGEPVRERPDHAGLAGGPHIADPGGGDAAGLRPPATEEHTGGADQKAQRDDLHPPQCPKPLGVGLGVGPGERFCQGRGFAWLPLRRPHRIRPLRRQAPRIGSVFGARIGSPVQSDCHPTIIRY